MFEKKKRLSNVCCNVIVLKDKSLGGAACLQLIIACLPATRVHSFQICTLTFGQPVPKCLFCSSISELCSASRMSFCRSSSFVPTSLPGLLTSLHEKYLVPCLPTPGCHSFLQETEAGLAQIPRGENFGGLFDCDCDSLDF